MNVSVEIFEPSNVLIKAAFELTENEYSSKKNTLFPVLRMFPSALTELSANVRLTQSLNYITDTSRSYSHPAR